MEQKFCIVFGVVIIVITYSQLEGITYSLGDEFAASGPCGLWDMPLGGSHAGAWTWRTLPYIGVLRPPQGLFSAVGAVRLPHSSK